MIANDIITDLHYFDDIRPFADNEIGDVVNELLSDPEMQSILSLTMGHLSHEELQEKASQIRSVKDFKTKLVLGVLYATLQQSSFSVTSSGKSNIRPLLESGQKCLFISNHRDIVLDSALLNMVLYENGLGLPRIAIGDNLLIRPWIRTMVKACDAFIVKRSPSVREMLQESLKLSQYIRRTLLLQEESVWIAQREGRAKDSNDRTQTALLKMLAMSSKHELPESLLQLNIVPLSITYEYDPCDYLKAEEIMRKRLDPSHKKSQADDLLNMKSGIIGEKGRIHFSFGTPLTKEELNLTTGMKKQEILEAIATSIDRQIHQGYRMYPSNYISYDLLHGTQQYAHLYSEKEAAKFNLYLQNQIEKIKMPQKDTLSLKHLLLEIYANPLINQQKAIENI